MNIIELHQDLINNNNIHQFSIITGEYLYEIMQTYYLPTTGECSFSCPWQKPFTLLNIQEYKLIIESASYSSYLENMTEYFYNNARSLRILKEAYERLGYDEYAEKISSFEAN